MVNKKEKFGIGTPTIYGPKSEIMWTKLVNTDHLSIMNNDTIVFGKGCFLLFYEMNTNKQETYQTNDEMEGIACFNTYENDNVFAFVNMSIVPSIYILKYPSFQVLHELRDNLLGSYRSIAFGEKESLVCLKSQPECLIEVWNWRNGRLLMSKDLRTGARDIKIRNSPVGFTSCICETYAESSISIWKFSLCGEICLCHRKHLEFEYPFAITDLCFTNNIKLFFIDVRGNVHLGDVKKEKIHLLIVWKDPEVNRGTEDQFKEENMKMPEESESSAISDLSDSPESPKRKTDLLRQKRKVKRFPSKRGNDWEDEHQHRPLIVSYNNGIVAYIPTGRYLVHYGEGIESSPELVMNPTWIEKWILQLGFNLRALATNKKQDKLVAWSMEEGLVEFKSETLDSVPQLTVLRFDGSGIVDFQLIHPEDKYLVTISQHKRLCIWEKKEGNLISKLNLHYRMTLIVSHPVYPYLVFRPDHGEIFLGNFENPLEPTLVDSLALTDEPFSHVVFSEKDDWMIIAYSSNSRILYFEDATRGNIKVKNDITLERSFCSISIIRLTEYDGEALAILFADKNESRGTCANVYGIPNFDLLNEINLNQKYNGLHFCGQIAPSFVGIPYLSENLHTISYCPIKESATLETSIPTGHQIRHYYLNTNGNHTVSYSQDGLIFVRQLPIEDSFFVVMNHHGFHGGVKRAIVDRTAKYIISLGYDGIVVCTYINSPCFHDVHLEPLPPISQRATRFATKRWKAIVGLNTRKAPAKKKMDLEFEKIKAEVIIQEIETTFTRLQKDVADMIRENQQQQPMYQLKLTEFVLNTKYAEKLQGESEQNIKRKEDSINMQISNWNKIADTIMKTSWEPMEIRMQTIKGMMGRFICPNFVILKKEKINTENNMNIVKRRRIEVEMFGWHTFKPWLKRLYTSEDKIHEMEMSAKSLKQSKCSDTTIVTLVDEQWKSGEKSKIQAPETILVYYQKNKYNKPFIGEKEKEIENPDEIIRRSSSSSMSSSIGSEPLEESEKKLSPSPKSEASTTNETSTSDLSSLGTFESLDSNQLNVNTFKSEEWEAERRKQQEGEKKSEKLECLEEPESPAELRWWEIPKIDDHIVDKKKLRHKIYELAVKGGKYSPLPTEVQVTEPSMENEKLKMPSETDFDDTQYLNNEKRDHKLVTISTVGEVNEKKHLTKALEEGKPVFVEVELGQGEEKCPAFYEGSFTYQYLGQDIAQASQPEMATLLHFQSHIPLLQIYVYKLRQIFNNTFNKIIKRKETEMKLLAENNDHYRKMMSELNKACKVQISEMEWEPQDQTWDPSEKTEMLLEVSEDEIPYKPYITPSQQAILDKIAEEEERLRRLKQPDKYKLNALLDMMSGVLKKCWEDELKDDIPIPQFIVEMKNISEYSTQEKNEAEEYYEKVTKLKNDRENYEKRLRKDMNELKATIENNLKNFDSIVRSLTSLYLKFTGCILQEHMKISRMCTRQLEYVKRMKNIELLKQQIFEVYQEEKELKNELELLKIQLKSEKLLLKYLAVKDHSLGKKLQAELKGFGLTPSDFEKLLTQSRKRPKKTAMLYVNPSTLLDAALGLNNESHRIFLPNEMLEYYSEHDTIDDIKFCPIGVKEEAWKHMVFLRREKIRAELEVAAATMNFGELQTTCKYYIQEAQDHRRFLGKLQESLEDKRKTLIAFSKKMELQMIFHQGSVEVDCTGHITNFQDCIVVNRKIIEKLFASCLEQCSMKIEVHKELNLFEEEKSEYEWHHEKMRRTIENLHRELEVIKKKKVTSHHLKYLREVGTKGLQPLEFTTDRLKKNLFGLESYSRKRVNSLNQEITKISKEHDNKVMTLKRLKKEIENCTQEIESLKNQYIELCAAEKKSPRKFYLLKKRSNKIREIQNLQKEIINFQVELQVLRKKVYPVITAAPIPPL